ncbi:MAG: cyclic nucleotide-binding domain-containing protein [Gammaproteobacteria bacterium]
MEITAVESDLYDFIRPIIGKIPLFEGLSNTSYHVLIRCADMVRLDAGETLIKQGLPADAFFILLEGKVSVYHERTDGEVALLGEVNAPAALGEIGLLLEDTRTATVVADTDLQAMRFRQPAFASLFDSLEGFGLHVAKALAARVNDLSGRIRKESGSRPAAEDALIDLADFE